MIPTVPARPDVTACTTAVSSVGRPTTQPGTSSSGGTSTSIGLATGPHTAATAATMAANAASGPAHMPDRSSP